jgi:hypothetical protein
MTNLAMLLFHPEGLLAARPADLGVPRKVKAKPGDGVRLPILILQRGVRQQAVRLSPDLILATLLKYLSNFLEALHLSVLPDYPGME